jgi:hypothetical protein
MTLLASASHNRRESIGLKNSGKIANAMIDMMQVGLNEECVEFKECDVFQPSWLPGNLSFTIEYQKSAPTMLVDVRSHVRSDTSIAKFSTLSKPICLDK